MAAFPYNRDFEPVARVGEALELVGLDKPRFFRVLQVEPIQEILRDFGSIDAEESSGVKSLKDELEMDAFRLAQIRVTLLDDVEVAVFQPRSDRLYSTRFDDTVIRRPSPRHDASGRQTAADTDVELWAVSGGRRARLVGLNVVNQSGTASVLRLGDGAGNATLANAKFGVAVPANGNSNLGDDVLGDVYFDTSIVSQQSAVGDLRINVQVEEENIIDVFRDSQNREIYVFEDQKIPHVDVRNPTKRTQPVNRVQFSGFKFWLEELPSRPERITPVPVAQLPSKGGKGAS